jgi:hypothetical protein
VKNPVYVQIQERKVKAKLCMLQHAKPVSGNISQTCRFFGVSRSLYYVWNQRYGNKGSHGRKYGRTTSGNEYCQKLLRWSCGLGKNTGTELCETACTCNGTSTLAFRRERF